MVRARIAAHRDGHTSPAVSEAVQACRGSGGRDGRGVGVRGQLGHAGERRGIGRPLDADRGGPEPADVDDQAQQDDEHDEPAREDHEDLAPLAVACAGGSPSRAPPREAAHGFNMKTEWSVTVSDPAIAPRVSPTNVEGR